jgi:hypothetical protein
MFRILLFIGVLISCSINYAQNKTTKEVNHQAQTWISINTELKFNEHWGTMNDVHIRRTDFAAKENFYFARTGITYALYPKLTVAAGYAHLWLASAKPEWSNFAEENRIYQQVLYSSKIGKVNVLQRIRNEQRWQDKMVNDEAVDTRFTNRIRYLLSFTIPVFTNEKWPSLVIADEILMHFGKEVVYNSMDQNRFFVGIRQNINPKWSYDFGYMNVYQQKYSGYQYDSNHTLRLFFYFNGSFKDLVQDHQHQSGDE